MHKLLVVIDYQKDFVDGALGFPKAAALDEGIAQRIQSYLAAGENVLFTYDTHSDRYLETREGRALPVSHCISGSAGWSLYGKTQEQLCETCCNRQIHTVRKVSFGMAPADVVALAAELGEVQEILLVGVVTNMCVISNAVLLQSQWPEAQITIDASLCASFDDTLHEKALDIMESLQMHIIHREV
ncbi:MAG: cysteine hydrolase family protein [Clostridia bacterium]|nr:cysteine hydrolase family protein [Clostridia bacterium]